MARVNTEQPYTLYETLFGRLLARCQQRAPRHGFRLKNKLFAVDASTIDLCLAAFPWASFRRTKGAIKLHVGLDQAGHLPTFISVTDGKTGDVTVARTWTFPAGSVVVAAGHISISSGCQLQQRGVTLTRLRLSAASRHPDRGDGDQTITRGRKAPASAWDEETQRLLVTNDVGGPSIRVILKFAG